MACGCTDEGMMLHLLAKEIVLLFFVLENLYWKTPLSILPCENALKGRQRAATRPSHAQH